MAKEQIRYILHPDAKKKAPDDDFWKYVLDGLAKYALSEFLDARKEIYPKGKLVEITFEFTKREEND
jgi:hypothetical protein